VVSVIQGSPSWQAGYNAGMSGEKPRKCPPRIPDPLAFWSGFISGKAARERAERLKNAATSSNS
jgi:hypothetical protein